ncbi:DUF956 family protein [Lacticaseibacillus nasuensis]|uniref:ManO protein n=1 Tax=Lacticaseibacillus nasuensis JCM 17158 TaxID=1291734 RepID=A0A0R1JRD5_9LACO|nr:DUF956 family protein [Lacticaseibacillus nasuensis]KRK73958.1 hypothetical protein FD02_GL001791 [Lacticaseibacillus nasuensis JCM 17158]MCX2456390.1 DUF956 family protein [Lacticaseibacillus nasuensis]
MVQSINSKVDLAVDGTFHMSLPTYGKIMVGNHGFEFYNDHNVADYVQIPWQEVDRVVVSVEFGGKWIPRFAFQTKHNGRYMFSAKDPKRVLRAVREYIPADHIVKPLGFWAVVRRGVSAIKQRLHHK